MQAIEKEQKPLHLPAWLYIAGLLLLKSIYVLSTLEPLDFQSLLYSLFALAPVLFFISFSFLLPQRKSHKYLLVMNFVLSLILFIDAVYARSFGRLISLHMLGATNVLNDLGSSIRSLLRVRDFLLFVDLPVLAWLFAKNHFKLPLRRVPLFFAAFGLATALMLGNYVRLEHYKLLGNYKMLPLYMSSIGNHIYDLYRLTQDRAEELTPERVEVIADWHDDNARFLSPEIEYRSLAGSLKGKNLIIIQFESLENFLIDKEILGNEITPNLNALLDSSLYFSDVIEQVKDGNSSDAELIFNTSMYPIADGSAFLRFGENVYNSLPKILGESGYTSVAIHGDDAEFWNRNTVFPKLGFTRYIDETQFTIAEQMGMGISDEALFGQSLHEIRSLPEPYNFFIITISSHIPFELPEEQKHLTFAEENISTDYLQSIRYVDEAFGRFYRALEQEGILDNAALVIYGDHEGIHKYYKTDLPDNHKQVPFIVHAPGLPSLEITNPGGQIDMMPTLLYLLGADQKLYEDTVMGRNLLGKFSGSPVLPTGELAAPADGWDLLQEALKISDYSIRGKFYERFVME